MRALGYDHFKKIRQRFTKPSVSVLVTAFHAQAFICRTQTVSIAKLEQSFSGSNLKSDITSLFTNPLNATAGK